jgi:hypothetical protein
VAGLQLARNLLAGGGNGAGAETREPGTLPPGPAQPPAGGARR